MKTENNTENVSTDTGWRLIADVCHKADKNELLRKALKKLANMNTKALLTFLGEVQIQFGRLKRVVSDISLEVTPLLNTKDFFKTKSEGGIFVYVDNNIFSWLDEEVKNSPAKRLAIYEFTENITEEIIIGDAKTSGIYEETNLAHVKQVCERHIVKGEKLLKEDNYSNLFWIRNKSGGLCKVRVWLNDGGWDVDVYEYGASYEWDAGGRSFFRN